VRASTTTGFSLAATPAVVSVTAGQSATSAVTVARANAFPSFVDISATGAPEGMTVSVSPNPSTSATTTVTVTTTAATAPGAYTITLTGVSTGAANATASIIVLVTAASGG
jgi:aminopeptidase S